MGSIHYFQRYSQKENVLTNNTLLLFSRLYQHSPISFQNFLNDLLDLDVDAGISFSQQIKGQGSVPDGSLTQTSFRIIVETKLHENFSVGQLKGHLQDALASLEAQEAKLKANKGYTNGAVQ